MRHTAHAALQWVRDRESVAYATILKPRLPVQGVAQEETDKLKAKYKELWDLDANGLSEIHNSILDNVQDGIPDFHTPPHCCSLDFQHAEVDPNVAPSDLKKVPSTCLEWQPQSIT